MTLNLTKGAKVNLDKAAPNGLAKVTVGLGWDVRDTAGADFDLDASAIGLNASGACVAPDWFVYYNNDTAPGGVIHHHGDNLTGGGDGDDEQITIDLAGMPADVAEVVIAVTIFEAKARGNQTFGLVKNAFVRIVDETTKTEMARYDLTEDTEAGVNCMLFGRFYRHDGAWGFRAIGDGYTDEIQGLVTTYKIG